MIAPAILTVLLAAEESASSVPARSTEPLERGVVELSPHGPVYLWQDFDRDGKRDVYVRSPGNEDRLLLNVGNSFEDVSTRYGLSGLAMTLAVAWTDFETDGLPDLYVVTGDGASHLFHNTGTSFVDVAEAAGVVHDGPALFHEWLDQDGDDRPDLHVVTPDQDVLFMNQGAGRFATLALPTAGDDHVGWLGTSVVGRPQGIPQPSDLDGSGVTSPLRKRDGSAARTGVPGARRNASSGEGQQNLGTCGTTNIEDQGAPGCLQASTTPTLGLLYPLSTNLNVDGTGQVGIGTTSPTQKLDVDGTIRSRSGGIQFPDGSTQTSAQSLDSAFAYGAGADPTATLQFLAPPATVTVLTGQKISVTSNKGLGSRYTAGACCLSLWVGYRLLPSGTISVLGGGIVGNKVNRNTRTVMGVNGILSGLAPGTYEVGMVGGTGDLHWDFNGSGYTSALVFD